MFSMLFPPSMILCLLYHDVCEEKRLDIFDMLYYNLNISEIIIVDLDSTDNTLNILKTFSKDFDFIKVLTLNEYKELLA